MTALATNREGFLKQIGQISRDVAALHADEVDREARFPREAIDALREVGALSAWIPTSLGGAGLELGDMTAACRVLGRGCSATAMIFAMHQVQVAVLTRHAGPDGWHAGYLARLPTEQRLIAGVTSEMGSAGRDMSTSAAALVPTRDGRLAFERRAPTVSYGADADDYLTNVRRDPEADGRDQVMVLHTGDQTVGSVTGTWDTLGMRGTCSPAFTVSAEIDAEQILPAPFRKMLAETMVPVAQLLWVNVWLGIASEAFDRGRRSVRAAARKAPGEPQPAARKLAETLLELQLMRAEVDAAVAEFQVWDASEDRVDFDSLAVTLRMNGLKIIVSERAARVCSEVLAAVGIMAFKNDSPFSVGRQLRDCLSGQVMVHNQRLLDRNAGLLSVVTEI